MTADPVAALHAEAARAHPDIQLDLAHFRAFLAPLANSPDELAALHIADLYLACAARHGNPRALTTIETLHLRQIPTLVARRKLDPADLDELIQQTREHLFLPRDGRPPKIADYAGRGPLAAWLRVVVLRLLGTQRRRARPHQTLDDLTVTELVVHSPEHLLARARWQDAFDAALADTFAALSPEQRALFRFQFGKGMTLDQIATVLGLHRATAARRIAAARDELWTRLTHCLRERLKLDQRELDLLLQEWRSKLDVSLSGILRDSTAGP